VFTTAFTEGGSDHNISFLNVVISWLAYCNMRGSDSVIAARISPTQSWTNTAECLVSVLNLALSNCTLSRKLMGDEFEKIIKKWSSMPSVRKLANFFDFVVVAPVVAPMASVSAILIVGNDFVVDVAVALIYVSIDVIRTFGLYALLLMFLMMW